MIPWNSHFNSLEYNVTGSLSYAVPNDGSSYIRNDADVRGEICLVDRGNVALVVK